MKKYLAFSFWPNKPEQIGSSRFSTPEIKVYLRDGYHVKHHMMGDNLFDLKSQCDDRRGFSIAQAYSLTAEIRLDQYHSHYAKQLLNRLTKDISFITDAPLIEVLRRLRKMKAVRFVPVTIRGQIQMIPRKHVRNAQEWWDSAA